MHRKGQKKMKEQKKTLNPQVKNDYQMNLEIANKIIEIIESGDVKQWRKAWTNPDAHSSLNELYNLVLNDYLAVNIYSLKKYNPILSNVPAGFYVTFIDIKKHGLKLAKGSKGVPHYKPACYNKFLTKNQEESLNELIESDSEIKAQIEKLVNGTIWTLKVSFKYVDTQGKTRLFVEDLSYSKKYDKFYYQEFRYILEYFFKASDCGLSNEDIKTLWKLESTTETTETIDRNQNAEKVKNSYIERTKLDFIESAQDQAYYMPSAHKVVVPTLNQFQNSEDYYQVVFHEFAHSTGHYNLLNRKGITGLCGFGSVSYSKEELVAELSSLYTLSSLKIITDKILENSIAYLKSWGQGLKEGIKHNILSTITQSRKATNLILNIEKD